MAVDDSLKKVTLTRRLVLWQRPRGHRSATDDIICAWVGHTARPGARAVLDLGAGQGSVTLMLAGVNPGCVVTAVEAQEVSYRLLQRNVAANASYLGERITPVHADLRRVDLGARRFDLVTGCPPYVRPGHGTMPRDDQRAAARFELRGGIEAYCAAAVRWLDPAGRAVFLMNAADDDRIRSAAAGARLYPVARLLVYPHSAAAARFAVYTLAPAPPGGPPIESALTIRDDRDRWTTGYAAARRLLDLP